MTLYFVKYLIELQKRQGRILLEGNAHILRALDKSNTAVVDLGARLFSMKNEIQLFDTSTIQSLTRDLHSFFLVDEHTVSPFINPEAIPPKAFKKAVQDSPALNLWVRKLVMVACAELLDANAQVIPEVIELLNLAETRKNPRLREVLIEQYVDAMAKHIMSEWFGSEEYQAQIRTHVFKQQSAAMLLANLKNRLEGALKKKNATANHQDLYRLVINYNKKFINFHFNTSDDQLTTELSNFATAIVGTRTDLLSELNKYIRLDYLKMTAELLERNAQLYPSIFIKVAVKALLPDLATQACAQIVEFGVPLANDFMAKNFIEFLKRRVSANIPVIAILNDEPVQFDNLEILSNGKGPTFRQLESSFNDLLLQNYEMNTFIKRWVHLAFAQILEITGEQEGNFNSQAIKTIEQTQPWLVHSFNEDSDSESKSEDDKSEDEKPEDVPMNTVGLIQAQIRDKRRIDQIRIPLITEAMSEVLIDLLTNHANNMSPDVWNALIDDLSDALMNVMPGSLSEIVEIDLLKKQNAYGNLRSSIRFIFKTFDFAAVKAEVDAKIKSDAKVQAQPGSAKKAKPPLAHALNVLIERRSNAFKKNQSITVESFIKDFTVIVSQQLLDQNGYQRNPIDNNASGSMVVMQTIQHVLTALVANNAVAKAVILNNVPSVNLQRLLHQISGGLVLHSEVAVAEMEKSMVFKPKDPRAHAVQAFPYYTPEMVNYHKPKHVNESKQVAPKELKDKRVMFQNLLIRSMQCYDADNLMIQVKDKIIANITPFTQDAVIHLEDNFNQLMLQYVADPDIQHHAVFKKFILTMNLLAYAEVLDENGDVKIDASFIASADNAEAQAFVDNLKVRIQQNRSELIAAFLRKLLITVNVRWIAQGKFESLLNDGMSAKALDAMLDNIEHALNAGVSAEVLKSLPTFPLFGREENIHKFIIPVILSPVKRNNPVLNLALDALATSNSMGLTLLMTSMLADKQAPAAISQAEVEEAKEAASMVLSTDELIASIQALMPKDPNINNADLFNFYAEAISDDEQDKSDFEAIQGLLAEFKEIVGPLPKQATTLKDVIKVVITKKLTLTKMSDDFQKFNDKYKSAFETINTLKLRAERALHVADAIYKEVHQDFSGSTAFIRKLRDQYKKLDDLIEIANFTLLSTGLLIKDLKRNGFLHSMQIFMQTFNQAVSKQQKIIDTLPLIDKAFAELQALATDWSTSKERFHAFKNICQETIPFLNRMENEIAEKRANVAQFRHSYLERQAILTGMLPEGSTFDDLQPKIETMETEYAAISANISALRKRCNDLFAAPIEELQNSDAGDFRVEITQAKNKLLLARQSYSNLGNEALAIATRHTAKKDQSQEVLDLIFLKLNMILTESPDFWERRVSFFGGGVAFVDDQGQTRKGPTRAVAMMNAAKALPFEQESDLKLHAILDAFGGARTSLLGLGQSKKTAKFYAIIQSLIAQSKTDFYNVGELKNIDGQISAFMQGYSNRYAFEARFERFSEQAHYRVLGSLFVPGVTRPTSAAMSYAHVATNPNLPMGEAHMYDVRNRGYFLPAIELPSLEVKENNEEKEEKRCDPPKPGNGLR